MSGSILTLKYFGNIEISDFSSASHEEDVSGFDIAMYNVVVMEYFESLKDVVGDLPDEVLTELIHFFLFLLDETLGDEKYTARSPPSANSMRMQRVLPNSSKKARL